MALDSVTDLDIAAIPGVGGQEFFQLLTVEEFEARDQFFADADGASDSTDLKEIVGAYLGAGLIPVAKG